LLAHKGIATLFGTGKESRGRLTAEVAIDALLVDVEFACRIGFPLVCFIRHDEPRTKTNAVACQGYPLASGLSGCNQPDKMAPLAAPTRQPANHGGRGFTDRASPPEAS
jgi:hypothetical protein